MSGRNRGRPPKRNRSPQSSGIGMTCVDCRKYSRKTLYCTKERKVTDQGKESCVFFTPRHQGKTDRFRRV